MTEVHATTIQDYKTCPRLYKYRHVMRLRPKGPQPRLDVGTAGHEALRAYYRGEDHLAVYDDWVRKNIYEYAAELGVEVPEKVEDEIQVVRKNLEIYPDWARQHDDFRVLYLEQEFQVPVFKPGTDEVVGIHKGRLDGVVKDVYGHVWIMEHKFYSRFPNPILLELDEQMGLYLLAAHRLWPDLKIAGVMYTVIRKVMPGKAATIQRYKVMRSTRELVTLEWNLYHTLKRIESDDQFVPSPGHHCTWRCPFIRLCRAENELLNIDELIDPWFERSVEDTANHEEVDAPF